jgi:ATP-dependent Clp protease ATP-binding subunit ClpA
MNIFLQAFDEGWLTDARQESLPLRRHRDYDLELGFGEFQEVRKAARLRAKTTGDMRSIKADVLKAAETRFSPEFRNRIDEIVIFRL